MAKFAFLKFLLLNFIEKREEITGYDFLKYCKENGIPASAGTVYPQLMNLKNKGILSKEDTGRRKIYRLTKTGKRFLKEVQSNKEIFKGLMSRVGIAMDNPYTSMPNEMQDVFKRLFYRVHGVNWKRKKDVETLLDELANVNKCVEKWFEKNFR